MSVVTTGAAVTCDGFVNPTGYGLRPCTATAEVGPTPMAAERLARLAGWERVVTGGLATAKVKHFCPMCVGRGAADRARGRES